MVLASLFHTCLHTTRTHELFLPKAESRGILSSFHNTSKAGTVASLFSYWKLEAQRLGR